MRSGKKYERFIFGSAREGESFPAQGGVLRATRFNSNCLPDDCQDWHRHSEFEIWWFTAGRGEYSSDFENYPLSEGTLVFVSMGQLHRWEFSPDVSAQRIVFSHRDINEHSQSGGFLLEFPFFFGPDRVQVLAVPTASRLSLGRDFEALLAELESGDPHHLQAARVLLRLLLIRAQRLFEKSGAPRINESAAAKLARGFWWLLEKLFLSVRRVQDYAARLQVTVNHLVETVHEQFGRTPGELIDERIYLEAMRLLARTTRTVSEIAYLLQFKTPSHFGAFFKRHAGCSPGEARRRLTRGASPHDQRIVVNP